MKKQITVTCDIDVDVIAYEAAQKVRLLAQKQIREEINEMISKATASCKTRDEVDRQYEEHLVRGIQYEIRQQSFHHRYVCADALKKETLEDIYSAVMSTALFEKLLDDENIRKSIVNATSRRVADQICERLGTKRHYASLRKYIEQAVMAEGVKNDL